MRRAALLLYDPTYRAVIPMGSHGVDPSLVARVEGILDETPVARRALEQDQVIEVSGPLDGHVPPRYAQLAETEAFTCTPIAAAGRWLGIILADRGGEPIELDDSERETMLTLGRLAALTASVERSTERRERERRLRERVELTRELHENAIQRLFGVSLVLGSERELSAEERRRGQDELRSVVHDLRRLLTRPVETAPSPGAALREVLERLLLRRPDLHVEWGPETEVPAEAERLVQAVLAEALRNADRHSEPDQIDVRVAADEQTFRLEVENDGLREGRDARGSGLGLRLAALEALHHEGLVEFGPSGPERWRVRLVVPVQADGGEAPAEQGKGGPLLP